jgi:hypothetical protein
MANVDYKIQRALIAHWEAVRLCIERLNNSASVIPADAAGLFQVTRSDADILAFDIGETLLILPERAKQVSTQMHIVVKGRLTIDKKHFVASEQLRTIHFQSEAGYFRLKTDSTLQHVFGAHYDLTQDEVGHPAFHAQLKSFLNFADIIRGRYSDTPLTVTNAMENILKTVRLPSAQMDYFSLLIQAVADHLMSPNSSSTEDVGVFRELLGKSKSIQGRAYDIARLQEPSAIVCYRSVHWYP